MQPVRPRPRPGPHTCAWHSLQLLGCFSSQRHRLSPFSLPRHILGQSWTAPEMPRLARGTQLVRDKSGTRSGHLEAACWGCPTAGSQALRCAGWLQLCARAQFSQKRRSPGPTVGRRPGGARFTKQTQPCRQPVSKWAELPVVPGQAPRHTEQGHPTH